VTHLLDSYGLVILFFAVAIESAGVPIPGETTLITAAVLASTGQTNWSIAVVIAVAAAGAIVGDNIGYWIGRIAGRRVLTSERGPFHHRRLRLIAYGDRFFARHGTKAVFIGRWIALVRVTAAWMAGMNHMPFRVFFLWNALGGITWAITIGLLGYYVGSGILHVIERFGVGAAVAVAVLFAAWLVWSRRREARELDEVEQAPVGARERDR
jgi:membrane-associated protein